MKEKAPWDVCREQDGPLYVGLGNKPQNTDEIGTSKYEGRGRSIL